MPSSATRHLGNPRGPIQGLAFPPSYRPDAVLVGTWSWQALADDITGISNTGPGAAAWPIANLAIAYPFELTDYFPCRKVWWVNGATVGTDSADVGVFTEAGARLVSGGGTLIAGASIVQEVDVTDTLLTPGRYWCAMSVSGTTATPQRWQPSVGQARAMGVAQMATAYPLPSTFTPAALASTAVPLCGIASRTLVA